MTRYPDAAHQGPLPALGVSYAPGLASSAAAWALVWLIPVCAFSPANVSLLPAEINGTIHITHRLTKQRVTPSAMAYQRGVAVPTGPSVADFVQAELGRVAIYLESEDRLPSKSVTTVLEQKDRQFVEDTVVIPAGSTVSFPNLDPIFHNVFSLSGAKSFDLGNYAQNETRSVTFTKPGVVRVYCHLHPNMSASIVVTPNRWNQTDPTAAIIAPRSIRQPPWCVAQVRGVSFESVSGSGEDVVPAVNSPSRWGRNGSLPKRDESSLRSSGVRAFFSAVAALSSEGLYVSSVGAT